MGRPPGGRVNGKGVSVMKWNKLKTAAAVLAVSGMAGQAWAETVCAGAQDLTALQIASVQQEMMVAALACEADNVSLYNSFVTIYQPELIASDEALLSYFMRRAPATGTDDYHSFKTKLANHFSVRSADNRGSFCGRAEGLFHEALAGRKKSLAAFALAQPMVIDTGYTVCGDSVQGETFASVPAIREEPKRENPPAPAPVLAAAPPLQPVLPEPPAVLPVRDDAKTRGFAGNLPPAPALRNYLPEEQPAQSTCTRMNSGYLDCYYGYYHYYRDPYGRYLPPPAAYSRGY